MAFDLSALDAHFDGGPHGTYGVAAVAPLASFEEDSDNPRFEEDTPGFELLVADVRAHGILQPVVVRRGSDGKLRIRFGARRYRAAVQLGLATIPYVLTEDARHFDDYAQVAENQRRSPMQPLELAVFAAKKLASGEKRGVVAERLGLHRSALTHLLCLTGEVPPFLLELYHSNKCRSPYYLYQLRGLWHASPQLVEQACAAAGAVDLRMIDSLGAAVQSQVANAPVSRGMEGQAGHAVASAGASAAAGAASRKKRTLRKRNGQSSDGLIESSAMPLELRQDWPQLFGIHRGREVAIDALTPASLEERVRLQFLDTGESVEAAASEVVLARVVQVRQRALGPA